MKELFGVFLVCIGICAGLFVGGYLCLYGGVISIIHGLQANPWIAGKIAFGVVRIVLASLAGWLSALLLILPGIALFQD